MRNSSQPENEEGDVMAKIIRREWASTGPLGKRVRHTADGDTLEVPHNNRAERIRLNSIGGPEKAHGDDSGD